MSYTIQLWQVIEMASADAMYYGYCEKCDETRHVADSTRCACGAVMYQCETVGDILDVKRAEPGYLNLYEDIRINGMSYPIYISESYGEYTVCNGHHRIAICEDLGQMEIPYTMNILDGFGIDGNGDFAVA